MTRKRISEEPAFVLHRYDWSESSLILETFTRHHGRVALVARGAKKASSQFRPVLLPLQPLLTSYGMGAEHAEIHALKAAEWVGGHVMPTGSALLAGYYLNELLLRLLARDDPHRFLFDTYAQIVRLLASGREDALEPALRAFELVLLREIGLLPSLHLQTLTLAALEPSAHYVLVPEGGLRQTQQHEPCGIPGARWTLLQQALDKRQDLHATLHACALCAGELKLQLRTLLQYHCGQHMLRTRQLMVDLQTY